MAAQEGTEVTTPARRLHGFLTASDADVLCYMDVDVSTGLRGLLPLIAPLVSGHSEIAIGSRPAPGSRGRARPQA